MSDWIPSIGSIFCSVPIALRRRYEGRYDAWSEAVIKEAVTTCDALLENVNLYKGRHDPLVLRDENLEDGLEALTNLYPVVKEQQEMLTKAKETLTAKLLAPIDLKNTTDFFKRVAKEYSRISEYKFVVGNRYVTSQVFKLS